MSIPEDKDREFELREAELQAKERELRLRELETEIYQEHKASEPRTTSVEPPLYKTKKHNPAENSFQRFGRKIVKFAKFGAFVVGGIAIIKVGFFVGMWITYLIMAGIIAGIGYQIFLKEDN
ncbi:MAG: UbiA family prenyltransferase [Cyanobacteria bacterium J06607_15]